MKHLSSVFVLQLGDDSLVKLYFDWTQILVISLRCFMSQIMKVCREKKETDPDRYNTPIYHRGPGDKQ